MKHVFLIGDSIMFGAPPKSRGYGDAVRMKLAGRASVAWQHENARFTLYTLRYLHEWAQQIDTEKIDIVHWNNGLWDALHLFGDEALTPIEVYPLFLKRIYKRIRMVFPNAKVIFALSTPVEEDMANPDFIRYNAEIEEYNRAAAACMAELGVPVNDLYSVGKPLGKEYRADWVHFSNEGCEILADAVVKAIEAAL